MDVLNTLDLQIQKILDVIKSDVSTIRTGRASSSAVENIVINTYGGTTRLKVIELATIAVSDAQTIVITPFDPSVRDDIRKGIVDAGGGLNPVDDGVVLRIVIPPLSAERREELIKMMKHKLENGKVMIRQARADAMGEVKKLHESKQLSDDDQARFEKDVQKTIDDGMGTIDAIGNHKEGELMQI